MVNYDIYQTMFPGSNPIEVAISSLIMLYYEKDGPYRIEVNLYSSDYHELLDTSSITTDAMTLSDLEKPGTLTSISDQGYDADGNGYLEGVQLDIICDVLSAGNYMVDATLLDMYGNSITYSTNYFFADGPGQYPIQLLLPGGSFYGLGVDGPYDVTVLLLQSDRNMPCDYVLTKTQAYPLTVFEHACLSPPFSHHGEDTNENGLFDDLVVEAAVEATSSTWCYVNAYLLDGSDQQLVTAQIYVDLVPGLNTVSLRLNALVIGSSGLTGPLSVRLEMSSGLGTDLELYYIEEIDPSQYENIRFTGDFAEEVQDSDGDGLFEALIIRAEVESTVEGEFNLVYIVLDSSEGWVTYSGNLRAVS